MPPVTRTMSNKGKRPQVAQSEDQSNDQSTVQPTSPPTPSTASEKTAKSTPKSSIKPVKAHYFNYVAAIPILSLMITASLTVKSHEVMLRQFGLVIAISIGCYLATVKLIPILANFTLKAGMSGIDLNKPGKREDKKPVPEALGLVSGVVYMIAIVIVQLVYSFSVDRCELVEMNAALHSICFMLFLGFADDVLELPWRYKLLLPTIASLPLLIAYNGGTHIIVPTPLRSVLPSVLHLGIIYQVYMLLLAVFCTNAINILAGLNGLEAGQSFVIACAVAIHNLIEVTSTSASAQTQAAHLFSLMLILPFIGSTLGLLRHNWYPSRVFVGDTFTTQAGMTFAVCGILGHFSKTLLLFFIPQIFNFLISLPQIIGLFGLTCPRHRLPKYDEKTGKLVGQTINHNLINVLLLALGPMGEEQLCTLVLIIQVVSCAFGFWIRYYVSKFFY